MKTQVLIVENDELMLKFLSRVLRDAGHEVLAATSREQANQAIAASPEPRDLILITDVVLNGDSGLAVARDFSERCPSSRIIFISGYASDVVFLNGQIPQDRTCFLQKPISRKEIVDAVDRLVHA
jgi:two-component system cell cycle sensor histidine kinase/response regulator CckA